MPQYSPGLSQLHYWIMSIIGTAILFLSVLIHELSHSIVASSYGIRVKQIMLFIFGGIADIEEEPKDLKEFKMAIAGACRKPSYLSTFCNILVDYHSHDSVIF